MKKLFENFRNFINEGDLSDAEKTLKNKPKSQLNDKEKKKLDSIQHKWMEEGRLSSDLQERYGIADKDVVGKVLWHSLNENGEIGVYDMKFGNTIVRNLLAENIEDSVIKDHDAKRDHDKDTRHGVQEEGDVNRGKKGLEEQWPDKKTARWVVYTTTFKNTRLFIILSASYFWRYQTMG